MPSITSGSGHGIRVDRAEPQQNANRPASFGTSSNHASATHNGEEVGAVFSEATSALERQVAPQNPPQQQRIDHEAGQTPVEIEIPDVGDDVSVLTSPSDIADLDTGETGRPDQPANDATSQAEGPDDDSVIQLSYQTLGSDETIPRFSSDESVIRANYTQQGLDADLFAEWAEGPLALPPQVQFDSPTASVSRAESDTTPSEETGQSSNDADASDDFSFGSSIGSSTLRAWERL